jgi:hypothetical protein
VSADASVRQRRSRLILDCFGRSDRRALRQMVEGCGTWFDCRRRRGLRRAGPCRDTRGHHRVSRPASRARRPSALPQEIPHDRPPIPIPWDSSPTLSAVHGSRAETRSHWVPDRQRPPLRPSGRGVPQRKCPPRKGIDACGDSRSRDATVRVPASVAIRSGGEQGFRLKAGLQSGFFIQREICCLTLGNES